jgi:hypothetical protein
MPLLVKQASISLAIFFYFKNQRESRARGTTADQRQTPNAQQSSFVIK